MCTILVRNAKLTRISEEFCKICDSYNLALENLYDHLNDRLYYPLIVQDWVHICV